MKTFLFIILTLIVVAGMLLFYVYDSFTYQPEYFESLTPLDTQIVESKADELKKRISTDFETKGNSKIQGDEIALLLLDGFNKAEQKGLKRAVKKIKSEVIDGQVHVEAIINMQDLVKQKMSEQSREYLQLALKNMPEDMLHDVYVSFKGKSIHEDDIIRIDQNALIMIGDFSQSLNSISQNSGFKLNKEFLKNLGVSDFQIFKNYIELKQ